MLRALGLLLLAGCTSLGGLSGGDADAGSSDASPALDGAKAQRSAYEEAVLADGPMTWLRFEETDGSIAHDETGRAPGTYASSGVKLGQSGAFPGSRAIAVDGSVRAGVAMPAGADFGGLAPFSVEAWISVSASTHGVSFVVDHEDWTNGRKGWLLAADDTGVGFERYLVEGQDSSSLGTHSLTTDAWHHVVATFDGTLQRIYVDGVHAATSGAAVTTRLPVTGAWFIGNQNCVCSQNGYVGSIDEVAIYDRALSEARVAAHFAAAK